MPDAPDTITCCKCGVTIGDALEMYGKEFLETETLIILRVEAICKKCGEKFYHSVSNRQLAQLVAEVKAMREKTQ